MSKLSRIDKARHAGSVMRYHTSPLQVPESVGHHTFNLINLILILTDGKASRNLLINALAHDMGEYVTGDLPSPIKQGLPVETMHLLIEIEAAAIEEIHPMEFPMSVEDLTILRLCDNLDGLLKCRDELYRGNRVVVGIGDRYREYIYEVMASVAIIELAPYREVVQDIVESYEDARG